MQRDKGLAYCSELITQTWSTTPLSVSAAEGLDGHERGNDAEAGRPEAPLPNVGVRP